jgi:hypothetical protein
LLTLLCKKVNQRLTFLYRKKTCLSMLSRKYLCTALLQCHIDYACASWYGGLTKSLKKKLQISQNKIIRFFFNYNPRHSLSFRDLDTLKFWNIPQRVKQLRLNHMFNIYHGKAPHYLINMFTKNSSIHRTRSSQSNFVVPRITWAEASSFFYLGVKDWNSLPTEIKLNRNKYVFKKLVKSHLLEQMKRIEDDEFCYYQAPLLLYFMLYVIIYVMLIIMIHSGVF